LVNGGITHDALVNGGIIHNALVRYTGKFIRESIQRRRLYRILPSTNDVFEIHTAKHVRIVMWIRRYVFVDDGKKWGYL
jgi:hypothetical protein